MSGFAALVFEVVCEDVEHEGLSEGKLGASLLNLSPGYLEVDCDARLESLEVILLQKLRRAHVLQQTLKALKLLSKHGCLLVDALFVGLHFLCSLMLDLYVQFGSEFCELFGHHLLDELHLLWLGIKGESFADLWVGLLFSGVLVRLLG